MFTRKALWIPALASAALLIVLGIAGWSIDSTPVSSPSADPQNTSTTQSVSIVPTLLLYFVLAYFLFAGLYSIVGALSNSLREGPQYAVIFTLPAVLPRVTAQEPDACEDEREEEQELPAVEEHRRRADSGMATREPRASEVRHEREGTARMFDASIETRATCRSRTPRAACPWRRCRGARSRTR